MAAAKPEVEGRKASGSPVHHGIAAFNRAYTKAVGSGCGVCVGMPARGGECRASLLDHRLEEALVYRIWRR